jgi:hypothetical protein
MNLVHQKNRTFTTCVNVEVEVSSPEIKEGCLPEDIIDIMEVWALCDAKQYSFTDSMISKIEEGSATINLFIDIDMKSSSFHQVLEKAKILSKEDIIDKESLKTVLHNEVILTHYDVSLSGILLQP